ncbi:MAG: hypothetical protein CL522_04290 [Actinobacteria bacterium]|nr:hypothetical protein [Actinomycetota bacterium]|tara:strand:+ start:3437 stop:3919 length:483 start_codon:yes stop_codon:yes gene_type:complete
MEDEKEIPDSLPEDLEVSFTSPDYEIPNNDRRRIAGFLYLVVGVVALGLGIFALGSPLANTGFMYAGIGILCVAFYSFFASASTSIDEGQALLLAESDLGFAAGPASAQMMWRGWGSKPVWRLLIYSQEPHPEFRAVVIIDAGNGEVLERVVEENPEDWT